MKRRMWNVGFLNSTSFFLSFEWESIGIISDETSVVAYSVALKDEDPVSETES